jgi:hypothetical protein
MDRRSELDSAGLGQGPVAGFCEHGDEPSGYIKKDFFDNLSDNQLFKQYSAPWSRWWWYHRCIFP